MKSLKKLLSVGMLMLVGVCGIFSAEAQKTIPERKQHKRVKWTPEEDYQLKTAVSMYGRYGWDQVSAVIPNRNPRQCRERYLNYLAPGVNNGKWSIDEDAKILFFVAQFGTRWSEMEKYFPDRSWINIRNRYNVLNRREGKAEIAAICFNIRYISNPQFNNAMHAPKPLIPTISNSQSDVQIASAKDTDDKIFSFFEDVFAWDIDWNIDN